MNAAEPAGGDPDTPGEHLPEQFEDGLQRERTALAWNRTALALIVAGSLSIQHLGAPYLDVVHVPAYAALMAGVVVLWLAATDARWQSKSATGAAQLRPRRAWGVGLIALALNVASLLTVTLGR
jgi:uncharacterized membrane protein YidH (DUF202 family)